MVIPFLCMTFGLLSATSVPQVGPSAVIDWTVEHQTIDGFGASDAFLDQPLTDAQADFYFTTNGIGLTFLRIGIDPDGALIEHQATWSDAVKASSRGARIWAAPWTAPAEWKDNDDVNNGGHLCAAAGQGSCTASHYDDWAARLAAFPALLKSNAPGVNLYALSIQNEPDYTASYQSMLVSNTEFVNFTKVLAPKLAALPSPPIIISGEYSDWQYLTPLFNAVAADETAYNETAIYATHQYWPQHVVDESSITRPVWQTEMSSFEAFDPSLANGITVAKWIHDAFVVGNVNVWHYWWLYNPYNQSNEGLIGYPNDRNATTKRAYTMGNYSKFIRPSWKRIDVSGVTNANLFVSAYKGPAGAFAIVAINDSASPQTLSSALSGVIVASVTPWTTTATTDLQQQIAVPVTSNFLSVSLPNGVTTLVGRDDRIFANAFQ